MSYSYMIIDNKIHELEDYGMRYDRCGTNIDVILKNKHRSKDFDAMFRRKLQWLQEKYPELLI